MRFVQQSHTGTQQAQEIWFSQSITGFSNQGIRFTMDVGVYFSEGGLVVRMEGLRGTFNADANFNPIEPDARFPVGMHVVARRDCPDCRPSFVRQSPEAGYFDGGEIRLTTPSVGVFIPHSELRDAEIIGVTIYGGNILFLSPDNIYLRDFSH